MRCGRLWWSWVQFPGRCFCVLVLVWFLRVSLFVLVLGLGFKSRPVRFVVFCVCGVFDSFFGGFAVVLGCTRTANRPNALRSSLVVLGSTPGSLFWCSCSCLVLRVFLFVLVLGSNPVQRASWCFVFASWLPLFRAYEARPKPTETH